MQRALVITGASKGIGRAAAILFQQHGHRVINISRTPLKLDGIINITADMTRSGWLDSCRESLLNALGECKQIDLIHCAATLRKDSVTDVSHASLQAVMQISVLAPVALNQLLLPEMAPGSSIIYVGSTLSEKAVANSFSYVTSKHAIIGAMRATCQDLAGNGVHTVCVCPGFTDTEMLRTHVGESEEILATIADGVAYKRLIRPEEIADTLHFCASNPVLNGSVIHANLGQIES